MKKCFAFLVLICISSTISLSQCLKGDCKDGMGALRFKNQDLYVGEFENGKLNGTGRLERQNGAVYEGEFLNNKFDGYGVIVFKNGVKYDGEFKNNKFHGVGEMFYKDGSIYYGLWSENMKNGEGIYTASDGTRIRGLWKRGGMIEKLEDLPSAEEDKKVKQKEEVIEKDQAPRQSALRNCNEIFCKDGEGYYIYGDGSRYEGSFENGKPAGTGVCYYRNGDVYVGDWLNHAPHGFGTLNKNDGKKYTSRWESGKTVDEVRPELVARYNRVTKPTFDPSVKIYAMVVGVARYDHMPSLKYTDDDAYKMYAFFKSPEGGALPDEQIDILIDEDANRNEILTRMNGLFSKADENDVVVMYYSGHGLEGNLIPIDFDGRSNVITGEEINQIFDQSKAKHKVCFVDACHSAKMLAARGTFFESYNNYYNKFKQVSGGSAYLFSSKDREVSLEHSGLRQGIFSHYLIRGLKGEADFNKDKIVDITELYDFVYDHVKKYSGYTQTPQIAGAYDPSMPVAMIR